MQKDGMIFKKHLMRRKIRLNRSMITNAQRSVEKMI